MLHAQTRHVHPSRLFKKVPADLPPALANLIDTWWPDLGGVGELKSMRESGLRVEDFRKGILVAEETPEMPLCDQYLPFFAGLGPSIGSLALLLEDELADANTVSLHCTRRPKR